MTEAEADIAIAAFGAVLQELLFWYNARSRLSARKYRLILQSAGYWIVGVAMALGSGLAAYVWFSPQQQTPRTYLLFGAAFPMVFKKAVEAFIPKQIRLGGGAETIHARASSASSSALRSYFEVS